MEKSKVIELFRAQPFYDNWLANWGKKIAGVYNGEGWSALMELKELEGYFDNEQPDHFILNAFNWALTPEGVEYWYFRNLEWKNTLKQSGAL